MPATTGARAPRPTPAADRRGSPVANRRLSPLAYRRVTLVALAALAVIIVTGAAVRLTGSGLGCTDWPTCEEGRLAPSDLRDAPAMVEFINRLITGIVSVAVILAVLGSRWRVPRRRDLTLLSWGLVAGVVAQVLLGGLVVLLHLSPKVVMAHFLLSMLLVWNAVALHHRAGLPDDPRPPGAETRLRVLARAVVAVAGVVVVTGTIVTASGPHAGDEQASRLGYDLPGVTRMHGLAVVALVATAVVLFRRAPRHGPTWRATRALLVVVAAQAAVGYTQYFTGVPALLVGGHICGAIAVWITAVRLPMVAGDAVAPAPTAPAPVPAAAVGR